MAGRGFGAQAERNAHAPYPRPAKGGGFDQQLARFRRHFAACAALEPGDALRFAFVRDDQEARVQRAVGFVERAHRLAVARVAHDQAAAREPFVIVEVQGLRRFQHHEIRDVDEVVDRPLAGQRQPHAHPEGRGSRQRGVLLDRKTLRDEALAIRALDRDERRPVGGFAVRRGRADGGFAHGPSERRREFAREPDHRHGVDAVGRDFDVEHVVVEPVSGDEIRARHELRLELQDAVVEPRRFEAELLGRAQHAFGIDAAHAARSDLEAGQLRADRGHRHDVARPDVGRRGRDRQRTRAARVDGAHDEPIGIGVFVDAGQPSDRDAAQLRAAHDRVHGKSERGQTFGQHLRAFLDIQIIAQPRDGKLHVVSIPRLR